MPLKIIVYQILWRCRWARIPNRIRITIPIWLNFNACVHRWNQFMAPRNNTIWVGEWHFLNDTFYNSTCITIGAWYLAVVKLIGTLDLSSWLIKQTWSTSRHNSKLSSSNVRTNRNDSSWRRFCDAESYVAIAIIAFSSFVCSSSILGLRRPPTHVHIIVEILDFFHKVLSVFDCIEVGTFVLPQQIPYKGFGTRNPFEITKNIF